MSLLKLPNEIILTICEYLDDRDKLKLTATCKKLLCFREFLYYDILISIEKIRNLQYKYNFKNLKVKENISGDELAKFKKLNGLLLYDDFKHNIKNIIPNTVKYLEILSDFNGDLKGCLPSSLKSLCINGRFNQSIRDCLPSTIESLHFGISFNNSIDKFIPSSVKYLKFGHGFNKPIKKFYSRRSYKFNIWMEF